MNRQNYYNHIRERLFTLSSCIKFSGKLNLLDLNLHSENFYRDFFNLLYGWHLENQNAMQQNAKATDLRDEKNKTLIQVSATNTNRKIQDSLNKIDTGKYDGYTFKFISIASDAKNLKDKQYQVPGGIIFRAENDIYDLDTILSYIYGLKIEKMVDVYDFIKKELIFDTAQERMESNLTDIINNLADCDLNDNDYSIDDVPFGIEDKIDYNKLKTFKDIINEYSVYQNAVDKIYSEYDKQGKNKSLAVLRTIRNEYLKNKEYYTGDNLFDVIEKRIENRIRQSSNLNEIKQDELKLYVDIILVNSFMKCKIFEKPK